MKVSVPDFSNYFEEPLGDFDNAREFLDDIGKNYVDDSAKILGHTVIHGKRIDASRKKLGAIIGDSVKIGINAFIMPGVKIGSGCQIGPAVLVDRDLEENFFYGYRDGVLKKEKLILCKL